MPKNKLRKLSLLSLGFVSAFLLANNHVSAAQPSTAPLAVQPPVFNQFFDYTVPAGSTAAMSVSATSPSGLPVTISFAGLPQSARYDALSNNFSWHPTAQDVGSYVVIFTATDGINTVNKTIILTVTPAPTTAPTPVTPVVQPPVVTQPPTVKTPVAKQSKKQQKNNKQSARVKKSKIKTSQTKASRANSNSSRGNSRNNSHND